VAGGLVDRHVLPHLAEAPERDHTQHLIAHPSPSIRPPKPSTGLWSALSTGVGGYAATSSPSRARQSRTRASSSPGGGTSGRRLPPTSWPRRLSAALIGIGFVVIRNSS